MEVRKALLIFFGTLFVVLGVLGMILPLMPTTVFLLLAAYCYSRSSEKFHTWLLTNRFCGKYISNYQSGRGISVRQKVSTIAMLWASIGFSIWMLQSRFWLTLRPCRCRHRCYDPSTLAEDLSRSRKRGQRITRRRKGIVGGLRPKFRLSAPIAHNRRKSRRVFQPPRNLSLRRHGGHGDFLIRRRHQYGER